MRGSKLSLQCRSRFCGIAGYEQLRIEAGEPVLRGHRAETRVEDLRGPVVAEQKIEFRPLGVVTKTRVAPFEDLVLKARYVGFGLPAILVIEVEKIGQTGEFAAAEWEYIIIGHGGPDAPQTYGCSIVEQRAEAVETDRRAAGRRREMRKQWQ